MRETLPTDGRLQDAAHSQILADINKHPFQLKASQSIQLLVLIFSIYYKPLHLPCLNADLNLHHLAVVLWSCWLGDRKGIQPVLPQQPNRTCSNSRKKWASEMNSEHECLLLLHWACQAMPIWVSHAVFLFLSTRFPFIRPIFPKLLQVTGKQTSPKQQH